MVIMLTSPAFEHEGQIPARYTCEADNISPHLDIRGVPEKTKSLALLVDDPDAPDPRAPQRVFAHWLVYDLPPDTIALKEDIHRDELPKPARCGTNDFGQAAWGGPCPPIGRHRYFFRLYALDRELDRDRLNREQFLREIRDHVIDQAELIGTYEKHEG